MLVTGGARRVGEAVSRHLGTLGARVLIHYHRSATEATELAEELGTGGAHQADLSHPEGPSRLFERLHAAGEHPDAVVHTAASFVRLDPLETTAREWDEIFALNLRSVYLLARELARYRDGGEGDFIAVGDSAGYELPTHYLAHSVAKAAVLPLVRALAKAFAPTIRVNGIIPGPVLPPDDASPGEGRRIAGRTLLGRLGEPMDVARAAAFLLTTDYATGSFVEVTGGAHLWRDKERLS